MKNFKITKYTFFLCVLIIVTSGCEREITDEAVPATFPNTADVFTDVPVNLTDEFFESFDPALGANVNGFGTDDNEAFEGTTSIRVDVPVPNDPGGGFIGGIFRDRGDGRDLTGYNALTFYAKGSTTASLGTIGFGADFDEDRFIVELQNMQISTDWRKYIVPIPDPSKLTQEIGVFLFSAGTQSTGGAGYTFWLDEIRYENLGTIGQERPQIFNGEDLVQEAFVGSGIPITGLGYTVNLPSGLDQTVSASSNYFTFMSSDSSVATVSDSGIVSVIGNGTATITATIGNLIAEGSLEITAEGAFVNAPDPTLPSSDVLSIYSDTYSNLTGLNVGAFNNGDISISTQIFDNNEHISYENLQFVGVGWDNPVDVSGFSHIHVDVQLTTPGSTFTVELLDYGPDGIDNGFGDGSAGGFNASGQLILDQWVGLDIPLSAFTLGTGGGGSGLTTFGNMGNVIFVSNNGSVLVDNIYFY
ncbi:MAG: Ig-like domain-containing protein [Bacteroidota bacterium]